MDTKLYEPTQRELMEARAKVLNAIGVRKLTPTPGLMLELATWNVVIGDVEMDEPAPVDVRTSRVRDIEYALNNEPVTKEQANELLDELAELGADIQSDPPEFGGDRWFREIKPIEF